MLSGYKEQESVESLIKTTATVKFQNFWPQSTFTMTTPTPHRNMWITCAFVYTYYVNQNCGLNKEIILAGGFQGMVHHGTQLYVWYRIAAHRLGLKFAELTDYLALECFAAGLRVSFRLDDEARKCPISWPIAKTLDGAAFYYVSIKSNPELAIHLIALAENVTEDGHDIWNIAQIRQVALKNAVEIRSAIAVNIESNWK